MDFIVFLPLKMRPKGKQLKKEEIQNFLLIKKPITSTKNQFLPWVGKAG